MPRRLGLTFTDADQEKMDQLLDLLKRLHGYAPSSYADLLRAALDFFLEAKQREWDARHPAAKRMGLKQPREEG
jgi:hypothetical protein